MKLSIIDVADISEQAAELFHEYKAETLPGVDLGFQQFEAELAQLPGDYAPPRGRLYIARWNNIPAGCIALRPLRAECCEMKRLYVRPDFRGNGFA
ncbi:MAG: GNAT family N-acetyltransferase [Oscillospiraceae bacterium]|jgi:GNAT superfamily N-acetyltransferase|nr:GNAT family N-acetyltransferase [Oscillospiraceae bacterium]